MTKKEFDLIKEVINECLKQGDISPAEWLVVLYRRHKLINNSAMVSLFNCLDNDIYVTCSMYDELKAGEVYEQDCL